MRKMGDPQKNGLGGKWVYYKFRKTGLEVSIQMERQEADKRVQEGEFE